MHVYYCECMLGLCGRSLSHIMQLGDMPFCFPLVMHPPSGHCMCALPCRLWRLWWSSGPWHQWRAPPPPSRAGGRSAPEAPRESPGVPASVTVAARRAAPLTTISTRTTTCVPMKRSRLPTTTRSWPAWVSVLSSSGNACVLSVEQREGPPSFSLADCRSVGLLSFSNVPLTRVSLV